MPTNFPGALDDFPSAAELAARDDAGENPGLGEAVPAGDDHSDHHGNLGDALRAVEERVGITGSVVATSHERRLELLEALFSGTGSLDYLTKGEADDYYDALGAAANAIVAHLAASNPHPTYLTQTEADALYESIGSGTGTVDYLTEAEGDARYQPLETGTGYGYLTQSEADTLYDAIGAADAKVDNAAYNSGTWDGVTTVAPSKNAVRDFFATLGSAAFTNSTAYDASGLAAAAYAAAQADLAAHEAAANPHSVIETAAIAFSTIDQSTITQSTVDDTPIGGTTPRTGNFTTVTATGFIGPLTGNVTGNVSGNAATVTTNANLTGPVTSVGNATTIGAGVVTLAMQANMATASVVYRKTGGAGAPEVQTLATLKTDLGLTGTNSGDQTVPSAATQAEQEAGSSTTVYTPPGRQQFHQSAAKAWIRFDGSTTPPTIAASYNVSSITDNGPGDYTINFTTAFSTSTYAANGTTSQSIGNSAIATVAIDGANLPTTTACRILTGTVSSTANYTVGDRNFITATFFGDQ